ncbi:MAG: serine/threonine-protein kinase, partial [Planctomycetota bacterium]
DHPNIARVLDAGKTDSGRPYFVMERVDGCPITEYCDRARLGPRERLELFRDVCAAVQHAHQQGVIHRDLKPSNVLVSDKNGRTEPKVIDFGIAKATRTPLTDDAPETQPHQRLGTPEYMSPEQTHSEDSRLDTRSDVYSLGVILYELLTGTTPVRCSADSSTRTDVYRRIRDTDPPRPSTRFGDKTPTEEIAHQRGTDASTLRRILQRDLDWIVMRAIARERERRYESVGALENDVRRFLDGDPVEARPPSARYRWSKFARRHRVGFAFGAGLLGVLLISTVVLALISIELEKERDRAQRAERSADQERGAAVGAREESDEVTRFLTRMLTDLSPHRSGHDVRVRDVLEEAAEEVEASFADRPQVRARLHHAIGDSYRSLGLYSEGVKHLELAVELRRDLLGSDSADTRESRRILGSALRRNGSLATARSILRALREDEDRLGVSTRESVSTQYEMAATELDLGNFEGARSLLLQCVATAEDEPNVDPHLAPAILSLGSIHYRFGELSDAERCYRRVVKLCAKDPESPNALDGRKRVAQVLQRRGESEAAIEAMRELVSLHQRVYGPVHPNTFSARADLSLSLIQMGEPEGRELLDSLLVEAG